MSKSVQFLLLSISLIVLGACSTISYVGDRYTPTQKVDVFYSAADVDRKYKVIGHLSENAGGLNGEEEAKRSIIRKCREVGADGVIILGFEHVKGETTSLYQKAEAIKYLD